MDEKIEVKNKICILFLTGLLFFSCNTRKNLNNLTEKETLYFFKDSNKPFSGRAYSTQTNLKGKSFVSAYYTFGNGIPNGKWKSYGYSQETIQEGFFEPLLEVSDLRNSFPNISRINICKYQEGKYQIVDIYIISKMPRADSVNFKSKKEKVLNFLIGRKLLKNTELYQINSCEIYSGEF